MALIYYEAIKKGQRTIEQVPLLWRAAVQAMLDADEEQNTPEENPS